jgi:MFS family permease
MTNDLVRIEVRGTYQAYINLFFGLGSSCGAAFGGFLCDQIGWRWTFGIQVPPVLAIMIFAVFTTPSGLGPNLAKNNDMSWRKILMVFDLLGSFLLSNAAAFLILGLNLGGNILPWKHPLVISSFVVSFIAALLLLWIESRAHRPILPLTMLFTTPRSNLVFSNFFFQLGTFSVLFNAPLYFQAVKLESPSLSGFRLAIPAFLLMICGVSCGFFMTRTGRMKSPQVAGGISGLLGAICLSTMWKDIPAWLTTIFIIPPSAGQGLMFPATTLAVLATSTQEDQAVMTTTLVLWRQLGIVMGVAVSSLIVQNALSLYLQQFVTGSEKAEVGFFPSVHQVETHNT